MYVQSNYETQRRTASIEFQNDNQLEPKPTMQIFAYHLHRHNDLTSQVTAKRIAKSDK